MTPKEMITVEKEVYDAVLRNSVRVSDLEAENHKLKEINLWHSEKSWDCEKEKQQLKELLKYCHYYIINTPVYPQGDDAKQVEIHKLSDQIINAIGENNNGN